MENKNNSVPTTTLINALVDSGLVPTKSDGRRLIETGEVKVDGQVIKRVDVTITQRKNCTLSCGGKEVLV